MKYELGQRETNDASEVDLTGGGSIEESMGVTEGEGTITDGGGSKGETNYEEGVDLTGGRSIELPTEVIVVTPSKNLEDKLEKNSEKDTNRLKNTIG